MFCDFDKIFHPEIKWKDKRLTDCNPCMTCEVRKEYEKYLPQIAMSEGFANDIIENCDVCAKHILWVTGCLQKLKWYEDNDERLKR